MTPLAASNPRIRRLRRLSGRRSARADEGAYLLEGPVLVAEAVAAGIPLDGIYAEPGALDAAVASDARALEIPVHEVADGVLTGITDAVAPRPVLAVAPLVALPAAEVAARAAAVDRPLLVLVEVRDPGNLGTILRAAEASGVGGVVCTRGTVDPWSPKAVRSSAGAILHVPVAVGDDAADALGSLRAGGWTIVATVVDGAESHDAVRLVGRVAVVLGGEAHGLDTALLEPADRRVSIPMEGRAESLNVAMAASVLCFEALRQRRLDGGATAATPAPTDWTDGPPDDKVIRP